MIRKQLIARVTKSAADLERERLNSLINSMADGVVAIDQDGKVAMSNGAALNILDLNSSMHGQRLAKVMKLVDANNQPIDVSELIRSITTSTSSRDYLLTYADGSKINLYLSIAPVHLGYGKNGSRGHVLLMRDITREKSLEEERNDFISVISHELRTPIAIAEGSISNAQFIAEQKQDLAQVKQSLTKAHQQVMFLSDMVNDIATLSRAEGNSLKLEVAPINVPDMLHDLLLGYRSLAENKGLQLHDEIDPSLELLHSSHLYVREILQNFLTNSIKYTETGSITLGARPKAKGVLFYISDTGIGISKADKERIFDKYFRSNDNRAQQATGLGMGLYIIFKLTRLLHAELEVESELNKGSTFSIFVPNLQ